jgi:RND family efflux transporter MFP subunit
MKKKFFSVVLIMGMLVSCSKKNHNEQAENKPFVVKTEKISEKEIEQVLEFPAVAESWIKVNLVPSSPGKIKEIFVDVGSVVKEGQLVALMDPTQFNTTKFQLDQLEKDYKRMDSLHKLKAISDQQFEQFLTNYNITKNSFSFIEENVYLKSPIAGTITAKYYNAGEMFSAAPNTKEGKAALLTVEMLSPIKINIDVPESYLSKINLNTPVQVSFQALDDATFSAKITKIYPTIDPLSRTFRIEIAIPNAQNKIKPGMYAVVRLNIGKVKGFLIPSIAVLKLQGAAKYYVFKNEGGIARQLFVQKGRTIDNYREVFSDSLRSGDEIIVVGQEKLVDGAKISIKN